MSLELQFEATLRLLLAAILCSVIGLEREARHQPAGLRTHMLVGFGAALFTILSFYGFPGSDTGRIAAQIVIGIGFIGAGTILIQKSDGVAGIKHLTTAASIWMTAGIGMAAGAGAWLLAIVATLAGWSILYLVRHFE